VTVKQLICLIAVPLPQPFKRTVYRLLGWEVSSSARIGLSYLDAEHVSLGPGAVIGHFNIVRNLRRFEMGSGAYIKHLNDFFGGMPTTTFPDREFRLGDRSLVMSRHFFDVSGRVTIGRDCILGGRDSQFWSHSRFARAGVPSLEPRELIIEDRVYTGARVTIVHCVLPRGATVGAGAVVTKSFAAEGDDMVIAGNPAVAVGSSN